MPDPHLTLVEQPVTGLCDWGGGACPYIPTEVVERDGEQREFCEIHADLDKRLRPPPGGPVLIEPPSYPASNQWLGGWNARAIQAKEEETAALARGYERGRADRLPWIPTFVGACVSLTVALILGVVIGAWL